MTPAERRAILEDVTERHLRQMQESGWWFVNDRGIHEIRYDRPTPWDINNGDCEEWAEAAQARVGGDVVWIEPLAAHAVLRLAGLYFDAQCLDGVRTRRELPIVQGVER
jgi:hypothetical protein